MKELIEELQVDVACLLDDIADLGGAGLIITDTQTGLTRDVQAIQDKLDVLLSAHQRGVL